MNIAVDIRTVKPNSAGKGVYTENLLKELLNIDQKNNYFLYTDQSKNPFQSGQLIHINHSGLRWHYHTIKHAKKNKIDLFFSPTSYIIPSFLPANIHSVFTVHDLISFKYPQKHQLKAKLIEKLLLKKALKKAEVVCTVSDNTNKDLYQMFPNLHLKTTKVPCAAADIFTVRNPQNLQKFIKETALPKKFFLAVASIIPRKNYPNLFKAFALLLKEHPHYHLVVVGGKMWGYKEVKQQLKNLRIARNVHFLNHINFSSLARLYNLAEALVFPSFYEGFGMPPLEAMQSGCPVITSNTSSLPEVVGNSALTVDPHHYQNIYFSMKRLINETGLKEKLIDRGLQQAKKYSWNQSAQKLLSIFNEIS